MFNGPKQPAEKQLKKPAAARDGAVTILTSGCHFSGKLFCRGASRIGGKIEGQIVSEGLLIIEEEAVIMAEVKADEAIIQGKVTGKLQATGRIELCATSRFEGDISTPVLIVREGAQFNGRSTMVSAQPEANRQPKVLPGGKGAKDTKGEGPEIGTKADVASYKLPEVNV
jgi:cytoskeletal protein CcmA (bactofilin family)